MEDTRATKGHITVPRWTQLAALPAIMLIAWLFMGVIEQAIFIFLIASLIAMVLNPLVSLVERAHIRRGMSVFVVCVMFAAILVGIGALLVPPISHQWRSLADALPSMPDGAQSTIDRLQSLADRIGWQIDVGAKVKEFANSLAHQIPSASRGLVAAGVSVVRLLTLTVIIAVTSIYMLLYSKRIGEYFVAHFPTGSRTDGVAYVRLAHDAVVNYVKAQLLLSLALGTSVGVAMWLLSLIGVFPAGGRYALFFGVWTAIMEAIPYLGPVMAAVPPTLVALFDSPFAAVWVLATFVFIQQVEGHILVPVIMGSRFRVNPLIVIFAILVGNEIHGVVGMFLAIPLIPLIRETIFFFRSRVTFEKWDLRALAADPIQPPDDPPTTDGGPGTLV